MAPASASAAEGVGGVVAAAHAQRVGRHEVLQRQRRLARIGRRRLAPTRCIFVVTGRAHEPRHVVVDGKAEVAGAPRRVGAEGDHVAMSEAGRLALLHRDQRRRGNELPDYGVVAIDDDDGAAAEHARLGRRVGVHRAVPVEMVLREVEQGRGIGLEAGDAVELEARELEHPDLGQRLAQCRGANGRRSRASESSASANDCSIVGPMLPAAATRLPLRSTSSAVIAVVVVLPLVPVMANELRRVVVGDAQGLQRFKRTDRARPARRFRVAWPQSSTPAMRGSVGARPGSSTRGRRRRGRRCRARGRSASRPARAQRARRAAAVLRANPRREPSRLVARTSVPSPKPESAEAEHERMPPGERKHELAHRSFRLAKPTRHSSMVMIQKRTTTCVSGQPDFSK